MKERPRGGVSSLQDALGEFLQASGLGRHLELFPIFDAWNQAVGEELAALARPVKFHRGELTIEVESAAHLNELSSFTGEGFRVLANQTLAGNASKTGKRTTIQRLTFRLKR